MNAPEIISDSNSWFDSLLHQQRSADSYDDSDGSVHEPSESTYTSRYQTEFKQIALVGWGGGGEVWKVSHRLDRREYAVKKITLDPIDSALNDKTTREVTTISRLIHNNVVRYYAAWVEEGQKNSISSAVNTSTELTESDSSDSISNCVLSNDPFYSALNISNSDVLFADSTGNKCRENEYSEAVSVANSRNHSSTSPLSHAAEKSSQLPPPTRILYIQMEFCYATLQEAILDGKLWQYPMEVSRLFRQLLEATRYVHSMRVIHRDLKPANVFLDSSGNIKIGDFGLATTDRGYDLYGDIDGSCRLVGCNTPEPIATLESSLIDLTCGVGTALYRAPEQEACSLGCTPSSYSSKADIYSLGIILFEMCHAPFSTGMERIVTIKALREHRTLPGDFLAITPAYFESLILWLVENDPDKRPTAAEVLTSDLMQQATGHIDSSPVSQSSSCTSLGGTQVACKKPVVENVHVFQVHIPYMHLRVFGTWINQRSQVTETAFAEYVPFPETLSGYAVVFQELMADMCAAYEGKLFDESCTTSKSGLIYAALYSTVDQLYDMIIFSPSVLSELLHKDAK